MRRTPLTFATAPLRTIFAGWAVGGLALTTALHLLWMFSPWPFASENQLADYVQGSRPLYPTSAFIIVISLMLAATVLVLRLSQWLPAGNSLIPRLTTIGGWGLFTVLALWGINGLVAGFLAPENEGISPEFSRWNLHLYSPFCISLAAGVFAALRWHKGSPRSRDLPAAAQATRKETR